MSHCRTGDVSREFCGEAWDRGDFTPVDLEAGFREKLGEEGFVVVVVAVDLFELFDLVCLCRDSEDCESDGGWEALFMFAPD